MAAGNPTLYLNTPENAETAGDAAVRYEKSEAELTGKLQSLLDDAQTRKDLSLRAKQRADALYRWEAIAQKYEKLFTALVKK
jgi:glycosyltransferase involved in cell wall biosynthesis